jgi:UDP-N-acetylmuramyl tripeptide synthase
MVLRDRRVELAILETARGGILRRGLAIDGIDVAALTNVTQDHLGEWGVDSLEEMARVKLTIGWALKVGGTLIVPLESEPIAAALKPLLEKRPDIQLQTFSSTKPAHAWADERFLYANGGRLPLNELPFTFDGTARHNVENALTATLVALALGLSPGAISAGLRSFTASIHNNPGRMNSFRLPNGAIVVVDVAHTPDGIKRIVETLKHWPHSRSILLLGQTGDRPDSDLQGLAVEVARAGFQKIVLKEMPSKLYNRHLGEVSYVLKSTLMAAGVPPNRISGPVGDEISGVKQVLGGAIRGDLILILCHETLVGTLEVLNQVGAVAV